MRMTCSDHQAGPSSFPTMRAGHHSSSNNNSRIKAAATAHKNSLAAGCAPAAPQDHPLQPACRSAWPAFRPIFDCHYICARGGGKAREALALALANACPMCACHHAVAGQLRPPSSALLCQLRTLPCVLVLHAPPPACQLVHSMNCRCDSGVSTQPFGPNVLRLLGSTICGQAMPAPPGPSGYGQAPGSSTDRPPAPGGESEEPDSDEYWWGTGRQEPATGGRDLLPRSESCFRQVKGLLQQRGPKMCLTIVTCGDEGEVCIQNC